MKDKADGLKHVNSEFAKSNMPFFTHFFALKTKYGVYKYKAI